MSILYAHNFVAEPNPDAPATPEPSDYERRVRAFYNLEPVSTGGAINRYEPTFEEIDDGDIYVRVVLPLWSQNDQVVDGVLLTLARFRKRWGRSAPIYARNNQIEIHVYFHWCDPD